FRARGAAGRCGARRGGSLSSVRARHPLTCTLFPYTTLFRSPESAWEMRRRALTTMSRSRDTAPRHMTVPRSETCRAHRSRSLKRSEEHTSELQSRENLVCRHLLEKKNRVTPYHKRNHLYAPK